MEATFFSKCRGLLAPILLLSLLSTSCALAPPVQEMSDARQAIRAAIDADARRHAPSRLREAESLMDQAARDLERGSYLQARQNALSAKGHAIRARDESLGHLQGP
jgi:hypothetical protein